MSSSIDHQSSGVAARPEASPTPTPATAPPHWPPEGLRATMAGSSGRWAASGAHMVVEISSILIVGGELNQLKNGGSHPPLRLAFGVYVYGRRSYSIIIGCTPLTVCFCLIGFGKPAHAPIKEPKCTSCRFRSTIHTLEQTSNQAPELTY